MIRVFCAIKIPDSISGRLSQLHSPLASARWTKPSNYHLTLQFIGNVDNHTYDEIKDVLEDIQYTQFNLEVEGLNFFGPTSDPKVFWAGIKNSHHLIELREMIVEKLLLVTKLEDKAFTPHITLARLKHIQPWELRSLVDLNNDFTSSSFTVREFHLYQSLLQKSGAEYLIEQSYELY